MEQAVSETLDLSGAVAFRHCYVHRDRIVRLNCCQPGTEDQVVFEYLEIKYSDGAHRFVYEDEECLERFLADFIKRRYTSYDNLFTHTRLCTEEKFGFEMQYYERRGREEYVRMPLEQAMQMLQDLPEAEAHWSVWGQYDKTVPDDRFRDE